MLKIMELSKKKPMLVGKISVKTYIEFDIDQYYGGIEMSCDKNFSSVTQEEFQNNLFLNNACTIQNQKDEDGSAYYKLKDGFEEVIENITSQKDIDDINMFFTTFVNQKIKASGRHTEDKGDTVLFGENLCSGNKIAKSRKFAYELRKYSVFK